MVLIQSLKNVWMTSLDIGICFLSCHLKEKKCKHFLLTSEAHIHIHMHAIKQTKRNPSTLFFASVSWCRWTTMSLSFCLSLTEQYFGQIVWSAHDPLHPYVSFFPWKEWGDEGKWVWIFSLLVFIPHCLSLPPFLSCISSCISRGRGKERKEMSIHLFM